MMRNYELTPDELKELDEICMEHDAIKRTQEIALAFAANRFEDNLKAKKDWWANIFNKHNIPYEEDWYTKRVGARCVIQKQEKDDEPSR